MCVCVVCVCVCVVCVCVVCVCVVCVCVCCMRVIGGSSNLYSNDLVKAVSEHTKKDKYRIGNGDANSHISSY